MEKQKIRQFRKTLRQFERMTDNQEKNFCGGISLPQCHVLLEIEEIGKATTGQLAKSLNLDKSTLSRTIDRLVNNGLIERLPNPTDRRYVPLSLTKNGQETCEKINQVNDAYYARALEHISPEKLAQIIENLSTMVKVLAEHESKKDVKPEC